MSSFPRLHKRRLKRHLLRNRTQRSTAIRVRVTPSLAITENTTTLPRLTLPTGGQANFYINNCGDFRSLQRLRATRSLRLPTGRYFRRAEKRSRKRVEQSGTNDVFAA